MKVYSGSEIRNVAVAGHNDTGKTTTFRISDPE